MQGECLAQSSVVGSFPAAAVENSLVRYENNHIVVYSERGDQGYFHLLQNITNGAPVRSIDLPQGLSVKDFKILDGQVYFVGEKLDDGAKVDYKAAFGFFDIHDVFYSGGIVSFSEMSSYAGSGYTLDFTSLNKMEAYVYAGVSHIVAVGELNDPRGDALTGNLTTYLMDIRIIPGDTVFYNNFISSGTGFGLGVFFDVALTDNYVVSMAHKGVPYDLSVGGYMMAMSFERNASPLLSVLAGYKDYNNINGSMMAVGMRGDNFAVTYSTNMPMGSYNQQQEIALFQIGSSGSITHTNTYQLPPLYGMAYRSYYEMDYNHATTQLCELSNSTLSNIREVGVTVPGFASIDKVSFLDFTANSLCSTNTASLLVSGKKTSSSDLYMAKIVVPVVASKCISRSSRPFTSTGVGISSKDLTSSDPHYSTLIPHTPNLVIDIFSVHCQD